jgi:ABC-2 type transport system permease protein
MHMKARVSRLLTYWRIYQRILSVTLQLLLEYRWNAIVNSLYSLFYLSGIFLMIQVIFSKTSSLLGYSKDEVILMFAVCFFMWALIETFFRNGFKALTVSDIATGEFDKLLLKPVSPVFLQAFSQLFLDMVGHTVAMFALMVHQMWVLRAGISVWGMVGFIVCFAGGLVIWFNILAIYSASAFFMTKSSELIQFLLTIGDHGSYPTTIYPAIVEGFFFTLVPVAYMSFVPVEVLLGKANWWLPLSMLFALIISTILHRWVWKIALRHYSSASS